MLPHIQSPPPNTIAANNHLKSIHDHFLFLHISNQSLENPSATIPNLYTVVLYRNQKEAMEEYFRYYLNQ